MNRFKIGDLVEVYERGMDFTGTIDKIDIEHKTVSVRIEEKIEYNGIPTMNRYTITKRINPRNMRKVK